MCVSKTFTARPDHSLLCSQPWLLSNIVDATTSKVPEHLLEFAVLERAGLRIGFIGLVEKCVDSDLPLAMRLIQI